MADQISCFLCPQETLIAMAKAVASSTAALVNNARTVASKCDDQALQNQVISGAKATALATQALIACTNVLSPTIDNPLCQEQLIEACKLVAAAVERIVIAAQVCAFCQLYSVTLCTLYTCRYICMCMCICCHGQ